MKNVLLFLFATALISCSAERTVQADMNYVTLVKIEDYQRYPDIEKKMFTWETEDNIWFVTLEPINTNLSIGARRLVMIPK